MAVVDVVVVLIVPSSSPRLIQHEATSRSISVTWETIPLPEQNGIITGYNVSISNLDEVGSSAYGYSVESLDIVIDDLIPYTTYGVELAAHTSIGSGPISKLHAIQTAEEGYSLNRIRIQSLNMPQQK